MRSLLAAQQTFVDRLVHLMKAVQRESGNRKKKVTIHTNTVAIKIIQPPKQNATFNDNKNNIKITILRLQ